MTHAETVHELAEILFKAGAEHDPTYQTAFKAELDIPTRVVHSNCIVPVRRLPERIRSGLNASVERNVTAFLDDVGIVCKVVHDAEWGRAFHLTMPGKLVGLSWNEVLKQLRDKYGEDVQLL